MYNDLTNQVPGGAGHSNHSASTFSKQNPTRKIPHKGKEVVIITSGNWTIEEGQVSANGRGKVPAAPLLLSGYLRRQGHSTHVLMVPSHHQTTEFSPDAVVVYAPWFDFYNNGAPAFAKAKQAWPKATTILIMYDSMPGFEEAAMNACPDIDYAALPNEKEISVGEIIAHGEPRCYQGFGDEAGILYRDENDEPAHDGMRTFAANLDHLPFSGREFEYFLRLNKNWKFNSQNLLYQRGCSLDCAFCTISGTAQRFRDPEIVAGEMELVNRTLGTGNLLTTEVMAKPKPLNSLLNALIARNVKAGGAMCGRCELIRDPGMLEHMKSAGIEAVAIGIEAATPEMRARIGKGFDNEQLSQALSLIVNADLKVDCSLISGMPWEDKGYYTYLFTLIEILARSENVRTLSISRLIPYTGLAITQAMVDTGIITGHYSFEDWNTRLEQIVEEYRRTLYLDNTELERNYAKALSLITQGKSHLKQGISTTQKIMAA